MAFDTLKFISSFSLRPPIRFDGLFLYIQLKKKVYTPAPENTEFLTPHDNPKEKRADPRVKIMSRKTVNPSKQAQHPFITQENNHHMRSF